MAASRVGASNRIDPRSSAAIAASRSRRSRPVRGRNPSNDQRGPATPDDATAASTADAPGIATTVPPAAGPCRDEPLAGVGHDRRAGVRDEREVRTAGEMGEELALAGRATLRVVAHRPGRDLVAGEQPARDPGVLGRDERHGAQDLERAVRDVAEIADRRRDDVQRAAGHAQAREEPGRRRG